MFLFEGEVSGTLLDCVFFGTPFLVGFNREATRKCLPTLDRTEAGTPIPQANTVSGGRPGGRGALVL